MRDTTLVFLVKKDGTMITDICLAMKKRGFGAGRYNGVGGKVEKGESIEDAARRETKEEIEVEALALVKRAELTFIFPHQEDWNQVVHVYLCESWNGEVTESEEMSPSWFSPRNIPYEVMWPDDIFWLPLVLEGKEVRAKFSFAEGDVITSQSVVVI
jgi:8-oxo-dGTP pyrophosphatase MutT (NUDIX family)